MMIIVIISDKNMLLGEVHQWRIVPMNKLENKMQVRESKTISEKSASFNWE